MGGMYVHSGSILNLAWQARDRAVASQAMDPKAAVPDATVAIILAAASCEAFINELSELILLGEAIPVGHRSPTFALAKGCAEALAEIDENKGSITLKYLVAYRFLAGRPIDKGINPYQDFSKLIKLRNALMHLKPLDDFQSFGSAEEPIRNRLPAFVVDFQQRGLALMLDASVAVSWFNILQTVQSQTGPATVLAQ